MEKLVFTKACLSDVRVIVVIMCVPLKERWCQTMTGWVLVLTMVSDDDGMGSST
jgi:hypothetical protein